jgi:hypothetical protein
MSDNTLAIEQVVHGDFPGGFAVLKPTIERTKQGLGLADPIEARIEHGLRFVVWLADDGDKCAVVGRSLRGLNRDDDIQKAVQDTKTMAQILARGVAYDRIAEAHADALHAAIMALPKARREEFRDRDDVDDWHFTTADEQDAHQRNRVSAALALAIRIGHFGGYGRPESPRDAFAMATAFQKELSGLRLDKGFIDLFDAAAKDVSPDIDKAALSDEDAFAKGALEMEKTLLSHAGGSRLYVATIHKQSKRLASDCATFTGEPATPSP